MNGFKWQREIRYYKKMRVKKWCFFSLFSYFCNRFCSYYWYININVCIFTSVSITSHPLTHDGTKKMNWVILFIPLGTANFSRFEFNCYEFLCTIEYKNLGWLNFQLFSKFITYVLWYLIGNISLESLIYSFFFFYYLR